MDELMNTSNDLTSNSSAANRAGFANPTLKIGLEVQDAQGLLEDATSPEEAMEENNEYSGVVSFVKERYQRAKDARLTDETRWLESYRNFRGIYGPDVQFTDTEKSRAFIKITKTKVLGAYGKITSILFSSKKFPIGIEETPVPEGVAKEVYFDPKQDEAEKQTQTSPYNTFLRDSINEELKKKLGPVADQVTRLPPESNLREGAGKTPTSYTWEPAKIAAKKMDDQIQDQLDEMDASKHLRAFAHELCLFGSGVWKGPFATDKEYPRWDSGGKYDPMFKTVPDAGQISIWNFYPDPDGRTMSEVDYGIERHRMTRSQLRALGKRPMFRPESISAAINMGTNYVPEYWESTLDDSSNRVGGDIERYEVLEYWGTMSRESVEESGIDLPKSLEDAEEVQVNIWICNGQLLRLVLNPFNPVRIPYYVCPYELNPYSIFGIGVAENMSDTQLIMNGFMRLAIDNAAISSNVVFEVDETNLVPGQDMSVYPGKIFRKQSGAPGQSLFATKYPNVTNECMMLFDKARQLADEATGMPSYAHGMSGIQSTGRTASGMSMLMGAADENIKSVIRNIDDYLLIPFGQSLYAWNMQFNFDKDIVGDLTVVARGTESLLRNEVRSQKLMQFLQITNNEADAPFAKRDYLLREVAMSMDLDPDKCVNDPREAAIQAEQMKKYREMMGIPSDQGMQKPGNPAAAPDVNDPTGGNGGGNVQPGAAPNPGNEGFTGNTPEGAQ